MKYKVGDRVLIKDIGWYNKNKNEDDDVSCGEFNFVEGMKKYCSETFTILDDDGDYYLMMEDYLGYMWTDEMIEGLVEEENTLKTQSNNMETETHKGYCTTDVETTNESKKVAWFSFYDNDFADKVELDLSNRELIQEDGKWFVVKKKKKYPKTYEECCNVLDDNDRMSLRLMNEFKKLINARNAYWKIAGEEMGLGKPWKPDWEDVKSRKYVIVRGEKGKIIKGDTTSYAKAFAFPTEEMLDAFKENFDPDIEICKELL